MKYFFRGFILLGVLIFCFSACQFNPLFHSSDSESTPTTIPTPLAVRQTGVVRVIGTTYNIADTYDEKFNRNFVLYDLSGFLNQDVSWQMEPQHMVLAHTRLENNQITYTLDLPITPYGEFHDVDKYAPSVTGVQIFAYWLVNNYAETDFPEKFEQVEGWPVTDLSVRFDAEGTHIAEGWMMIWSEDNQQLFPIEVGPDGLLFTDDDIMQPVEPGYTSVYLERGKLYWSREPQVRVSILPPYDQRTFDLSHKDNSQAYAQALDLLEKNYPGWGGEISANERETLSGELADKMESASTDIDDQTEMEVYGRFVSMLDNGLVELEGNKVEIDYLKEAYPADFGILVDTMADGSVRITDIRDNSTNRDTNLSIGDTVLEINGLPVDEAINAQTLAFFPTGNSNLTRKLQEIFIFRQPENEKMSIKVRNIVGEEETYTLSSSPDTAQMEYKIADLMAEFRRSHTPVEFQLINGYGIIQVYDMDYDRELTVQMFENAVNTLQAQEVEDYIIDLRSARGTRFLHLAGFFTPTGFELGTLACGNTNPQTISLHANGEGLKVNSINVLVGSGCRGACELEALAFEHMSRAHIYGESSTYGAYDIDYQVEIRLPNQVSLSFPYCHMQELHLDTAEAVAPVHPQTEIEIPFIDTLQGSTAALNQVLYAQMEQDYKKFNTENITVTSQGALYQPNALFYRINSQIEEDEYNTLKYHESGGNDFHIINEETDIYGYFEMNICKPVYDELFQVTDDVYLSFSVDGRDVSFDNLISQYYFNEDDDTHCMFWIFGVNRFARGYHEVIMNFEVEDPVIMFDSLWEPGDYAFNYKFYMAPAREE